MKQKFLLTPLYLVVLFKAGFTFSGTHCTYKNFYRQSSRLGMQGQKNARNIQFGKEKKGVNLNHG